MSKNVNSMNNTVNAALSKLKEYFQLDLIDMGNYKK